jgi:uncharacterized protein (DUF1697 family)
VALLRGINIGSRNRIAMPELRELLSSAGFEDVRTYVQSGNVVLSSKAKPEQVASECERQIAANLGLEVAVIVRTRSQLAKVVSLNPLREVAVEPKRYQVAFCARKPDAETVRKLTAVAVVPEQLVAAGRELYAWYPDGVGRSKLAVQMSRLGPKLTVTARNWNTVTSLLAISEE